MSHAMIEAQVEVRVLSLSDRLIQVSKIQECLLVVTIRV